MHEGPGRCTFYGGILNINRVLLVLTLSVQEDIRRCLSQQPIDKTDNLSASNDLWIDEVTVQIEDEVNDLGRVHALLNILN